MLGIISHTALAVTRIPRIKPVMIFIVFPICSFNKHIINSNGLWGAGFRGCESISLLTSPFGKGGMRGILKKQ